jgi:hypothetical protein
LGKVDGGTGYTYLYYNGTTTQLQQALQQRNGDLGLTSTAPAFNNGLPTNYWAQETVINDDGTWVQYWAQPVDNLLVSNPGYNF